MQACRRVDDPARFQMLETASNFKVADVVGATTARRLLSGEDKVIVYVRNGGASATSIASGDRFDRVSTAVPIFQLAGIFRQSTTEPVNTNPIELGCDSQRAHSYYSNCSPLP